MINKAQRELIKNKTETKKVNQEWNTTASTTTLLNFGLEVPTNAIRQVKEIHKGWREGEEIHYFQTDQSVWEN